MFQDSPAAWLVLIGSGLWAPTEEVSMGDTCCHRIVRAAFSAVLVRDSVVVNTLFFAP